MSEKPEKGKLNFEFFSEGFFAFKSSVFKLSIINLPMLPHVGLARELAFPIYETIKENFQFFDKQDKQSFVVSRYKSKASTSSGEGVMLSIRGSFKSTPRNQKKEYPSVSFDKQLALKFSKYEDAEIYHSAKWEDSLNAEFNGSNISVDDLLMGVGVYVSDFIFGIEEYSKYGLGYRWFNVPSKRAAFEVKIGKNLEVNYKISKGTSEGFLNFLSEILDNISEIFALDENALSKFSEIKGLTMELG